MRFLSILVTVGGVGALACSHATGAAHQGAAPVPSRQETTQAPAGGQQAPEPGAPKPYSQVITSGATTDSGVFTLHRIGEKLFYEIPMAMFGREFLMVADQRGTVRGVRYAGEEISNGDRRD